MNILPIVPTLQTSEEIRKVLGEHVRVYEDIAPLKRLFPYVVWSLLSARPENNLDCPAQIDHLSFQIVVYSNQQQQAYEVRALIRKILEPNCYITNVLPNHIERVGDTNIFGRGFAANWWLNT